METRSPAPPPTASATPARGARERLAALLRRAQQELGKLKREHASPVRLGVAVGVGVLVGSSPFLGLQLLIGLALATLLRLNRFAVLLGLQISIPPFTPLLLFANAQVGALLVQGHWLPLSLEALRAIPPERLAAELFVNLLVGGLVVGGALALLLGGATALTVEQARLPRALAAHLTPGQWEQLDARLAGLPRAWRSYARWKLRLDPVYALALAQLPEDVDLLDLGSGMGLLPLLLHARSARARVRAVEWDARKVRVAQQLLRELPGLHTEQGDARAAELGCPGAIALFDVLHYSPPAAQAAWLERCARALAPGGLLLVRELEPRQGAWAPRLERLVTRWGWNRGAGVQPWAPTEMAAALTALGLTTDMRPAGSGLFRANTLLVARKPPAPTSHGH